MRLVMRLVRVGSKATVILISGSGIFTRFPLIANLNHRSMPLLGTTYKRFKGFERSPTSFRSPVPRSKYHQVLSIFTMEGHTVKVERKSGSVVIKCVATKGGGHRRERSKREGSETSRKDPRKSINPDGFIIDSYMAARPAGHVRN